MAHLIRPVRMGPVLSEKDIQTEQLSPDEEAELLKRLRDPARGVGRDFGAAHEHRKLLQELEEAGKVTQGLTGSLQELEKTLEDYEESLVPSGHHPVHHERISED